MSVDRTERKDGQGIKNNSRFWRKFRENIHENENFLFLKHFRENISKTNILKNLRFREKFCFSQKNNKNKNILNFQFDHHRSLAATEQLI
jgi:hypothetical protein